MAQACLHLGAVIALLPVLYASMWSLPPGQEDDKCTGLRHLENGRTFFRYGGLYVTFTCNPGFKIHGYRTNSCVSGRWSRDPPLCVASGCPDLGQPLHGSSMLNKDRSFVVFTCDQGYRLFGFRLLYCKGKAWNSTRPVCKESDVMTLEKYNHLSFLRFAMEQNIKTPLALKNHLQFQYNNIASTVPKDVFLKPELLDKESLENSHHKSYLQEEVLKEVKSRISVVKRPPVKHWSRKAVEGIIRPKDTNKERSDYEQPLSTMLVPLAPSNLQEIPEIKLLSTSSSDVTTKSQLASYNSPSVHEQHIQVSTPEVGVLMSADHMDPSTIYPTSTSSDLGFFQGVSTTNSHICRSSGVEKIDDYDKTFQAQEIYSAASEILDNNSAFQIRSERHEASINETSSGLEKLGPESSTDNNFAVSDSDAVFTLSSVQEGHNGTAALEYLEAKISGYSAEDVSITNPNNLQGAPADLAFTSSYDLTTPGLKGLNIIATLKTVIYRGEENTVSVITAVYDEHGQREIPSVETFKELQPGTKLLTTATPEACTPQCLGPHQSTHEMTTLHVNRDVVGDYRTVTPANKEFVTSQPTISRDLGDWIHTGSHSDSDPRNIQEYETSTAGWLGNGTSLPASHNQENKTGTFPGERPHLLPTKTLPSSSPTGSRDLRKAIGAVHHWLYGQRRTCPYPPLPLHGTFYFRTVTNPTPLQYRYFVQYACYPGYTLAHGDTHSHCLQDGKWSGITPVCVEETPCLLDNSGCSQICEVDSQKKAQCRCRSGFQLLDDHRTCRDIDECAEGSHDCQEMCLNTFGSFECSCGVGFLLTGDGRTCEDRDECAMGNGGCAHHCANSAGTFRCFCQAGFQLTHDLANCQDIDECLLPVGATSCFFGCINMVGSYRCHCPEGYHLAAADGHCIDIDECAENSGRGLCAMECQNAPGSFRCSCSYGYVLAGDGRSCVAECPAGYHKQSEGSTSVGHCVDVDECQEVGLGPGRCEWKCVNLPGSYHCICPHGYRLDPDGHHCKDVDECRLKNGGCSHTCINYKGGYRCACPGSQRFTAFSKNKCHPIN